MTQLNQNTTTDTTVQSNQQLTSLSCEDKEAIKKTLLQIAATHPNEDFVHITKRLHEAFSLVKAI